MNKTKKIFLVVAAVFLALLIYASYDFARRTTFPGKRNGHKTGTDEILLKNDSLFADSTRNSPEN